MYTVFRALMNTKFVHTENDGDFAIERKGKNIWFFFQQSNSKIDWKNNFDFPVKPYKDMGVKWYCHRGFLRVWKSIEPYINEVLQDQSLEKVYIVGYSHGGAIATLCHEYVWFNRPDLREIIQGYVFGSPRVLWGFRIKPELKERWKNLHMIRNGTDIVTHLPPKVFGFKDVNKVYQLEPVAQEKHSRIKCVNYHYPENYYNSLVHDFIIDGYITI